MPAPIVTLVEGTPESCRATANELGEVRDGAHDLSTGLFRVRGESESCWTGDAGDKFRQAMTTKGNAGNDTAEATGRAKVALEKFADELQTVIARMNQARAVAAEHGLTLTPDTIEPPGPRPPEPTLEAEPLEVPAEDSLPRFQQQAAAMEAYERKVRGFEEAKAAVEDARRTEANAHLALEKAMKYELNLFETLLAGAAWSLEGVNRSMVTTPQGLADKFNKQADSLFHKAAQHPGSVDAAGLTPAQRASRTALLRQAAKTRATSMRVQTLANRIYSRTGVSAGDARILGKSFKGVPVVGTGIAIGLQTEAVINQGKPLEEGIGNVVGSTAGGALSGALATTAVGSLGGPVGVLVVVGASALGAGVGGYVGENFADQLFGGN